MIYFIAGILFYFLISVFSAYLICYFYPQFRPAKVLTDNLLMSPFLGIIIYLRKAGSNKPES